MYMNMHKRDDQSAQEIQADLSEIERDLTLRRLLWQSQEEWTKMVEEWTATSFDALPVEMLQKNVNRYSQTVFMLEKGISSFLSFRHTCICSLSLFGSQNLFKCIWYIKPEKYGQISNSEKSEQ